MDVVVWLRSLGLGQYEAMFRQNDIDETVLPNLRADDLKELGVASLGTAGSSSMLLPHCAVMRARRRRQPLSLRKPTPLPKTAPSAAKSQ